METNVDNNFGAWYNIISNNGYATAVAIIKPGISPG